MRTLRIGSAGWTIPREEAARRAGEGTHLERYSRLFNSAEINSSFHRPHRESTYARWAGSVPDGFLFSVKMPKEITHKARLRGVDQLVGDFLRPVEALRDRFGCLLVQLPPSLAFEPEVAGQFFGMLRERCGVDICCEPRHPSWLEDEADSLLTSHRIARVAADPDRPEGVGEPGGWPGLRYFRLHGSPRMYYSSYPGEYLEQLATRLLGNRSDTAAWCIFDNTTLGAATGNARTLLELTSAGPESDAPPPNREETVQGMTA